MGVRPGIWCGQGDNHVTICSDPAPGTMRSAAWGQADKAFFSPPVSAHQGPGKSLFKGKRHL